MVVAWSGIDKRANDVLRTGFCHDKPWQILVNHSGNNPKFSVMSTVTSTNTLDSAPSVRYVMPYGLTVDGKSSSTGAASVGVKYQVPTTCGTNGTKCPFLPLFTGLSLSTCLERKMVKSVPSDSTELSAEYARDAFHGRVKFNPSSLNWGISKCLTFDKMVKDGSLSIGGEVNGGGKDLSALKYTVGACYTHSVEKPWTIAVKACPHEQHAFGKVTGTFSAATEKGHAIAVEVQHIVPQKKTDVTFAGLIYLTPKKETFVKAKLLPNAQVSTVLSHKFSDNLTGSFGCQFASIGANSAPINYGMKLAVKC